MSNKVHNSRWTVPFSWENKPGISKVDAHQEETGQVVTTKLPPPPCPPEPGRASLRHDLQIPLPPCAFQPPSRSCSRKGLWKKDDPFLTAYKECTKSSRKVKLLRMGKDDFGLGLRKNMSIFSCKQSCSVRDDNTVRISQLPISKSLRQAESRGF